MNTLALLALLALAAPPGSASVATPTDDPAARKLLLSVEAGQRSGNRMVSVQCSYSSMGTRTEYRMLGLVGHERDLTRLLYVMTAPSSYRGTALSIEDWVDASRRDRMWLAFPGLRVSHELSGSSLKVLVPGTGITYGESRGWLPAGDYWLRQLSAAAESVRIEALPRTREIADQLGASRLELVVDPRRRVVTHVASHDHTGNRVRSYSVEEFAQLKGRWLPERVRTVHHQHGVEAEITYGYASLSGLPPTDLFRPDTASAFLDRLLAWRKKQGLEGTFPDTEREP